MERGNDWGSPSLMLFTLVNGWIIALPFFLLFTFICTKDYQGLVSVYIWKKSRPYWSVFWTAIFGYLTIDSIKSIVIGCINFHFEDVVSNIFVIYIYACLRASIIASLRND